MISAETKAYREFTDKFKPRKTTDDCYTPDAVYDVVAQYVADRYGLNQEHFVRPFWPGADYREFPVPDGGAIVDDPPFSILSKIVKDLSERKVPYFLFAPTLTILGLTNLGAACIIVDARITYANGAVVNTSFVTNLDDCLVRSDPYLRIKIEKADSENKKRDKKELPKYEYPPNILTASDVGCLSKRGVEYVLNRQSAVFIRNIEQMRRAGKNIFGGAFLLSTSAAAEKAAAEKAAAEKSAAEKEDVIVWQLSRAETALAESIGQPEPEQISIF